MATLLLDKISLGKTKTIYALKGDTITIISDHKGTLIVENDKTKERFSVKECDVKR
jgi:hypothetical protein